MGIDGKKGDMLTILGRVFLRVERRLGQSYRIPALCGCGGRLGGGVVWCVCEFVMLGVVVEFGDR